MAGAADPSSKTKWKEAFSLVELLVVMAILAVLASLLLPALSRSKRAASKVQCQSNLKQWGLALLMYVDDFRHYAPAFSFGASGRNQGPEELVALYFTRQNGQAVWEMRCRQKWVGQGLVFPYNEFARSVALHTPYLGLGGEFVRRDQFFEVIPLPESGVKVPSDMIAFSEQVFFRNPAVTNPQERLSDLISDFPRTGQEEFYPHGRTLNQVFCDGHVEEVSRQRFASQSGETRRRWFSDNQPHPEFWP